MEREAGIFFPISALNAAVKKDIKTGHKFGQLIPLLQFNRERVMETFREGERGEFFFQSIYPTGLT